jgi:beta-lactamase regulating signal transducer with metallopeptidase domain
VTTDAIALWKAVFWVLVHGTALAVIAWAVSATLLRRARPAIVAALWSIVLLKFVVPVGPAMPWSVSSMIDRVFGDGAPAAKPAVIATTAVAPQSPAAASVSWLGLLALVATAAWLCVAAIILVRRVREHVALRRRAETLPEAPRDTTALVAAVARRLGLRRTPDVRVTDGAVPWVLGARRPVLVLPAQLTERDDLAAVVGHELAHLRRRDAWLRLLQVGAGALLFFWPVVRMVNRRIDAARELACDAWAIERGPLAPHEYARVLVRLVRRAQAAPAGALALAAHPHLLGRRVDALLAPRRRLRAGVGLPGVALLAGWGVLALGGTSDAHASAAAAARRECRFDPQLAAEIMAAYPQADVDGDGRITRDEACELQLELGRIAAEAPVSLAEELASNDALRLQCGSNGDTSASPSETLDPPDTCTQD